MGDAAGISPELAARMLVDPAVLEAADLTVIGDRRVLEAGARVGGVELDIDSVQGTDAAGAVRRPRAGRPLLIDLGNGDPAAITLGQVSAESGRFATENFRRALRMAS